MINLFVREAPPLVRREAQARPATFNTQARTIEVIAATTTPVRRADERGEFLEILDIAGADVAALRGGSVLDSHQQHGGVAAVVGTVEDAWREGDQLIARLRLSDREEIRSLVADIGSGIVNSVSVGYEVESWQDGERDGTRTRTATKWKPREISLVPVGADPRARTRSRDNPPTPGRASINREIRALARRAGTDTEVADDLIDRSATLDEARMAMFDNLLARGAIGVRALASREQTLDDPQVFVRAAGEALFTRASPRHTPSGPARQFVGMPLPEIARECLRRAGVSTAGLWGEQLITRALGPLGSLHSTSDFPLIINDVIGRTLRESYAAAPSGIRQIARESTAPDFRTRARVMLDSSGFLLEKVNEHGEFRSGTIAEAAEAYKIDTYGRIFGITRQALVNDDLGAFTDLTRRLGLAAAAFEAQFLVDLIERNDGNGPKMSDQKELFHTDHHNVVESSEGEPPQYLNEAALSDARLALRTQTSSGGALITLTPRWLVVPAGLETLAEKLLADISPVRFQDVIPFVGSLTLVVEPRLKRQDRWYVVCDPSELEFAYLAGFPGPQVETQSGFRIDGVETRVRLDYGAGVLDWRGFVRGGAA